MSRLAAVFIAVLLASLAGGMASAQDGSAWCESTERWVGILISQDRYDLNCSGVTAIEQCNGGGCDGDVYNQLMPRYQGDIVNVSFALLREVQGGTKAVYRAAYLARVTTAPECDEPDIAHTTNGRVSFECKPHTVGTHNLILRSGGARLVLELVVPADLPTRREFEDAELAKRPKVELVKGRITSDRIGYPEFNVTVRNNSTTERVTFVEIRFWFYNNGGGSVGARCGHQGASWWWNTNVASRGKTSRVVMDRNACLRGATRFEIALVKAVFSDGTTYWGR